MRGKATVLDGYIQNTIYLHPSQLELVLIYAVKLSSTPSAGLP
jgi:hypothetical protein